MNLDIDILARYFNIFLLFPIFFFLEYTKYCNLKKFLKNNFYILSLFYFFNYSVIACSKIEYNFFVYNIVLFGFFVFLFLSIIQYIKLNNILDSILKEKKDEKTIENEFLFFIIIVSEIIFITYFIFDYLRLNSIFFMGTAEYCIMLYFIIILSIIIFVITSIYVISKFKFFIRNCKKLYILLIFISPIIISTSIIKFYNKFYVYLYQQSVIRLYNKVKNIEEDVVRFNDNVDVFKYNNKIAYVFKKNDKIVNAEIFGNFKIYGGISKIKYENDKKICIESNISKNQKYINMFYGVYARENYFIKDKNGYNILYNYLNKSECK